MLMDYLGKDPIDWSFIYAVKDMLDLADTIENMIGTEGDIYLGDIVGFGQQEGLSSRLL